MDELKPPMTARELAHGIIRLGASLLESNIGGALTAAIEEDRKLWAAERDRYKVALEAVRLRAGSAARNSESALRDIAKLAAEALAAQPGERG